MKCKCCDRDLSDKEIIWNDEIKDWELCTVCLDAAMDAAYCDGFSIEEDTSFIVDTVFDEGWGGDITVPPMPISKEPYYD